MQSVPPCSQPVHIENIYFYEQNYFVHLIIYDNIVYLSKAIHLLTQSVPPRSQPVLRGAAQGGVRDGAARTRGRHLRAGGKPCICCVQVSNYYYYLLLIIVLLLFNNNF